tara:strand:- start:856 stop:1341 length:486 start_codon:yes stop_codon:yes gene_type:complete
MINIVRKKDGKIIQSPQKKQLRTLMTKVAGGTRPKGVSKDLLKKIKNLLEREQKIPDMKRKSKGVSPGKIKAITGKNPGEMKKPSSFMKRREGLTKPTGRMSKADMTRAAGMGAGKGLSRVGGAALSRAVFNQAKKLKPSGRLSVSDMKRARDMLKKRKGK